MVSVKMLHTGMLKLSVYTPVTLQLPAKEQKGMKEEGESVPSFLSSIICGGWLLILDTWGVTKKEIIKIALCQKITLLFH